MSDKEFLQLAIKKSEESVRLGAFPVGAIIVQNNIVIAEAISNGKQLKYPTSHAETAAIRAACQKLQTRNLKDAVLYSSLEPCLMCYSSSLWASIPKIVYACSRQQVTKQHYEGDHDINSINTKARHPVELIQILEMEETAREIIKNWEKEQESKK